MAPGFSLLTGSKIDRTNWFNSPFSFLRSLWEKAYPASKKSIKKKGMGLIKWMKNGKNQGLRGDE
jgi:hypothetical protein